MARLISDASKMTDIQKSLNVEVKDGDMSFANIASAISVVQKNMGLMGTTAQEGEATIEGSTRAMKGAWQNLITGIADENANLGELIKIFTDNAVIMFKNTVPRIKQIVKGLGDAVVRLGKKYAPELTYTIVPILKSVGKTAKTVTKFIVDNFKVIAPVVMTAVTAFTTFNAVMKVTTTITTVTSAIKGLTAGVSLATKAQTVWNAVMTANPIGAIITGVTALIALIGVLAVTLKSDASRAHEEETNRLREQSEAIQENIDSWNDLKSAQQQEIDAGMTQLSHYQALNSELQTIVDANGRVKSGYEERASFITGQLKDAFGVEIEMVDGVIQNYSELQTEIDKVIEKKKAQILLDAQEDLYVEAMKKRMETAREYRKIQDDLTEQEQKIDAIDEEITKAKNSRNTYAKQVKLRYLEDTKKALTGEYEALEKSLDGQKELRDQYEYYIAGYNNNLVAFEQGKYDQMIELDWNYNKQLMDAEDAKLEKLKSSLKDQEELLEYLKEKKKESGTDLYDLGIENQEKIVEQARKSLEDYTNATTSALEGVKIVWKDGLDKQLSEITGRKITFKETSKGLVQMYVDGVKEGKPKSKSAMAKLVTETINEISKQKTGAKTAGEDLINGINNGIGNQKKQNGVFGTIKNFGKNLLKNLKDSLKEQSPSKATKQMGEYLLEGLGIGISNKEKSTISQIKGVGENVLETLNNELNQDISLGKINMSTNQSGVQYKDYANNNMINNFKEALSEMKIILDDKVAGQFIDKTVSKIIYS